MKRKFDQRHLLLEDDQLSSALRRLPRRTAPAGLTTSLRVLASQERQRAQQRGWSDTFTAWIGRTRLHLDNLMRPLMVPCAGGVLSAVALFGVWLVPTYPQVVLNNFDVPTTLTTEATVKGMMATGNSSSDVIVNVFADIGMSGSAGDVIVDVFVDDQGRMVDYNVVSGNGVLTDAALRRRLDSVLVFTEFFPATAFGRPTSGRMRLSVVSGRNSSIDVKG
jgi:hypothetical protein